MTLKIIYEDENVLVVDKPAGLAVHATNINDKRETLVSLLITHCPSIADVGDNPSRPGIVHRLDKETSGLMVIAKDNKSFSRLKTLFKKRQIEKKYTALVSGVLEKDNGIIDTPLIKIGTKTFISKPSTTSSVLPDRRDRPSYTAYNVIEKYSDYTLVEVMPKTGRQHQIRVHFTSINHPIACDKLYGRNATKCPTGLNRHFLHASYLKFSLNNALMEFEIPLAKELKIALESIKS